MNISVFCGSNPGHDPQWIELAYASGQALARAGYTVVYGGGNTGLMGALADGALSAGGMVMGVMVKLLADRERTHLGLQDVEVTENLSDRKSRLIALADACLVLPGGLGTLDELYEVMTCYHLGQTRAWSWLLNHNGFYDGLIAQMEQMKSAGFIHNDILPLTAVNTLPELLSSFKAYQEHQHV